MKVGQMKSASSVMHCIFHAPTLLIMSESLRWNQ